MLHNFRPILMLHQTDNICRSDSVIIFTCRQRQEPHFPLRILSQPLICYRCHRSAVSIVFFVGAVKLTSCRNAQDLIPGFFLFVASGECHIRRFRDLRFRNQAQKTLCRNVIPNHNGISQACHNRKVRFGFLSIGFIQTEAQHCYKTAQIFYMLHPSNASGIVNTIRKHIATDHDVSIKMYRLEHCALTGHDYQVGKLQCPFQNFGLFFIPEHIKQVIGIPIQQRMDKQIISKIAVKIRIKQYPHNDPPL